MADQVEAVVVTGEPVPESAFDRALLGTPSLVTLKHDTEGEKMKVRILRACNVWLEGDTPDVHADYARQLIGNGLAEEVKGTAQKAAPTGKAAA
jgi:hypothetical protein